MRDIESILDDLDEFGDILVKLIGSKENEKTPEGKEYYENEIEFVAVKMEALNEELENAEREEARRFNNSNERAMSEAGHNERDFL